MNIKITDTASLGKAIRQRRKELHYTQAYLAEFTGFSASFISDLENGKATAELGKTLFLIQLLGMDLCLETLDHLLDINTTVAFCNELIGVYVARKLIPSRQHLDEDEFLNVQAYDLDELLKMIDEKKITDGKTVAALLAYKLKYA